MCPNWPDLRRDCDGCWFQPMSDHNGNSSELTWFTKGLRLQICIITDNIHISVRIDLIYEGIATFFWISGILKCVYVRIDLIYEGIATLSFYLFYNTPGTSVRIDLIYEGIATFKMFVYSGHTVNNCPNWPDLRRDCDMGCEIFNHVTSPYSPNWPDLRRDCDPSGSILLVTTSFVRIDLIYEGIAT